ncbi:hypothetical protein [Actinomadura sp. 9N215]|uniref:hypothetical protein n=1 Tax=Actinomadura sp. 9N215 TaxID=3375150 RepID=UPI00378A753C
MPSRDDLYKSLDDLPAEHRPFAQELILAQYQRLTGEITQQINRRESVTTQVFAALGSVFTMTVLAFTAGQWVKQPLIGLYGASIAALILPVLLLFLFAKYEHADLRIGQLAYWVRDQIEPLMPDGMGWDSRRREHFPARPWLRGSQQYPALAQPRNLQLWATRALVCALDGLALSVGISALTATLVIGPWWTWLAGTAGLALVLTSATASVVTLALTRHSR